MPTANDIRPGQAIMFKNDVCIVMNVEHRTPGNLRAFVQATLRNIRTGNSAVNKFSSTESVEIVPLYRKKFEFSYADQTGYNFMDPETYETVTFQEDLVGPIKDWLVENGEFEVLYTDDIPASIDLPPSIVMKVTDSPEGVKGDSASNTLKPATLESGLTIQVPLFIKEGDMVKVNTSDKKYMGRENS